MQGSVRSKMDRVNLDEKLLAVMSLLLVLVLLLDLIGLIDKFVSSR